MAPPTSLAPVIARLLEDYFRPLPPDPYLSSRVCRILTRRSEGDSHVEGNVRAAFGLAASARQNRELADRYAVAFPRHTFAAFALLRACHCAMDNRGESGDEALRRDLEAAMAHARRLVEPGQFPAFVEDYLPEMAGVAARAASRAKRRGCQIAPEDLVSCAVVKLSKVTVASLPSPDSRRPSYLSDYVQACVRNCATEIERASARADALVENWVDFVRAEGSPLPAEIAYELVNAVSELTRRWAPLLTPSEYIAVQGRGLGLPNELLAQHMGKSVGAVYSLVNSAREKLGIVRGRRSVDRGGVA